MKLKFMRTFSWMLIANAVTFGLKWLMIIVIAKVLSANLVGEYSLAFAITAPIALFAQLKLRSIFVTEKNIGFSDFLYVRRIINLLSIIVMSLISILFYKEFFFTILVIGASKLLDLKSEIYYAVPHKKNELAIVGQLMIVKNVLMFISFFIALILFENLNFSLLSMLLVQYLIFILIEKRKITKAFYVTKKTINYSNVKNILITSIPLGIVAMLFSFTINVPRYVLEHYESTKVLGYFSAVLYILTVSNLFQIAISQVFLPKLSVLYQEQNKQYFQKYLWRKLMVFSVALGISMLIVIFVFDKEILLVLYGEDYIAYSTVFKLSMVATFINLISGNLDTALIAMRAIKNQPLILCINLVITLGLSIPLISTYGVLGATFTMILSSFILTIFRYLLYKKNLKLIA